MSPGKGDDRSSPSEAAGRQAACHKTPGDTDLYLPAEGTHRRPGKATGVPYPETQDCGSAVSLCFYRAATGNVPT